MKEKIKQYNWNCAEREKDEKLSEEDKLNDHNFLNTIENFVYAAVVFIVGFLAIFIIFIEILSLFLDQLSKLIIDGFVEILFRTVHLLKALIETSPSGEEKN